ncbi:PAS domain S-box protein [Roseivivax sp.]
MIGLLATFIVTAFATVESEEARSPDIYLLLTAFLFVAVGAFYKLQQTSLRRDQMLMMQRKENAAMRVALDTHAIVSVTDAVGTIIDVNERFVELTGYTRSEAIGRTPRFLHECAEGENTFHVIRKSLDQGLSWHGEHCSVTKNGERRWFEVTVVPMMDRRGKLMKAISVRTDVTEQRAAEGDRQMRAILDNLQDEVFIYNLDDTSLRYMNRAACDRFGWALDEVAGKSMRDIREDFEIDRFRAHVAPLLEGKVDATYAQGKLAGSPVEVSTSILETADGERVFISILRDIRERHALARAKLSSVSVVSHELRTPLTAISGAIKMLRGRFEQDMSREAAGVVEIAERNCDRLLFIVNDILDVEKIEAGKMAFDKKHIDLNGLVNEAVTTLQTYASGLNVRIALESDCDNAMVEADQARLMQVMSNLVSNAAKYSSSGDVVTVSLADNGNCWRVAVRDSGPGISRENQKKLFDTFAQISAADGKKRLGTGLGLAITRRILDNHQARIAVQSEIGKGSTFYFDIPKLVDDGSNRMRVIAA